MARRTYKAEDDVKDTGGKQEKRKSEVEKERQMERQRRGGRFGSSSTVVLLAQFIDGFKLRKRSWSTETQEID